jgi:hypothetical protein
VSRAAIAARWERLWTTDVTMDTLEIQGEWAQLKAEWAALPRLAKRTAWEGYTEALDHGDAGYHHFHPVLWTLWELGEPPA